MWALRAPDRTLAVRCREMVRLLLLLAHGSRGEEVKTLDLRDLTDRLTAAEQRQTDAWLTLIEMQEAIYRARVKFIAGEMPMERFMDIAHIVENAWESAMVTWRLASDEVATLSAAADEVLL